MYRSAHPALVNIYLTGKQRPKVTDWGLTNGVMCSHALLSLKMLGEGLAGFARSLLVKSEENVNSGRINTTSMMRATPAAIRVYPSMAYTYKCQMVKTYPRRLEELETYFIVDDNFFTIRGERPACCEKPAINFSMTSSGDYTHSHS